MGSSTNQGGVEDYKTIRFEFDPTYERAFINQIEVTDENGTILSKTDTIESYVSDTSAQDGGMATTTSTVTATVPGLKPGCTLRYQFTIQSLAPKEEFPFYLRFAASGAPAGPRGFFVTGDFDSIRELSSNTQFLTTHDEHHRSWYLLEPARYYQESLLPSFQDYLPFLALGSGNTNWKTLGDEYLQELEDRLHPDPAIIELAQSLTSDLKDDHAKAAALVRHVQDRLVYQAIEFGVRGRIPERTPRILQNNYGDCKDHSLLIYQLLKSVNIPAHLALVNSSLPVIPEIPSLDQFDHMIVFAPSIRGGSFYDATAKNTSTAIRFPDSLKDSQALVLRVNASSLMTIPTDPDVTHEVRIQRRIDAQKAPELLTISEDISLHGSYADGLRHYMLSTNKAERRQMLEQILGRRLLISIKQLDFNNLENPNLPLEISITYTVSDSFQTRGEKLQSATPKIWEDFYFGVDQSGERRSPFKIQQAVKVTSQVSISLPDHLTFASPTWKSRESLGPGYSNELKILDDDSIQFILQIHPRLFEKEHFTEYSKGLSKSLQALQGDLRLQLPK